ncbi:antirestriction protein ArdA [Chitinophaga sp. 22321]|uniref:Antirestriction protein ArdA n=1 Tax=Chitinophaga hostae TaxID=2831022 RepID=A0ABS5IW82_9BACT|nr:antirestriction protein ArdA [Chitinophaga hostae]MBS0027224.1 antirestriction protein ArdA [Chitinophaga hostae]
MTQEIDITEASVYVGTYHKYNNGSLYGKWLKLGDYADKDDFYDACNELHKDEDEPEMMFQDYENIPEGLIKEYWISEKVFEIIEAFANMDESQKDPFLIWCTNKHYQLLKEDINDLISSFQDDYIGEYDSEEDFALELIELRDDLNEFAKRYFDYKAYANDIFCSDYWYDNGFVFYNS